MTCSLGPIHDKENIIGLQVFCNGFEVLHGPQHVTPVRHDNEPGLRTDRLLDCCEADGVIMERYNGELDHAVLFQRSERAEHRVMLEFCGDHMERHTGLFCKAMYQQVEGVRRILREDELLRRTSMEKCSKGLPCSRRIIRGSITRCPSRFVQREAQAGSHFLKHFSRLRPRSRCIVEVD